MSVSLAHCMVTVCIGLSFALMAFLLLRVALLTSPAEKVGRNVFRALPGVFFAAFAMYIVLVAVSELPEDSGHTPPPETSPLHPPSAGLPLVVGQVVVTRLPEFAFMHSNGSGNVELSAIVTQPSPVDSDNEDSPSETPPVSSRGLVPVAGDPPWRHNVVRSEPAGPNDATP